MNESCSQAILVLGMHRSGTSALTGMLSILGADLGPSLMPAQESINPKGFWEHADIVAVHEKLLLALDSSWQDERPLPNNWWQLSLIAPFRDELEEILKRDFAQSSLWLLKDPRMCRLLPMWKEILCDLDCVPHFVICLRSPFEVARSLECRDRLTESRACLLWLEHLLETEKGTRGYSRIVITYDQLLADWQSTSRLIAEGLSLPLDIKDSAIVEKVENFLQPSLRHHNATQGVMSDSRLSQLASNAYMIAKGAPLEKLADALAPFFEEVEQASRLVTPWATQLLSLQAQNAHLEQTNFYLLSEVTRLRSTFSWQVTKPLRLIANLPGFVRRMLNRS